MPFMALCLVVMKIAFTTVLANSHLWFINNRTLEYLKISVSLMASNGHKWMKRQKDERLLNIKWITDRTSQFQAMAEISAFKQSWVMNSGIGYYNNDSIVDRFS